jgi:hypothetical protein
MIRYGKYRRQLWNNTENMEKIKLDSDKIWKIQQKIVKLYGKYGRNPSWILKWFGKYRIKVCNDMEHMEDSQVG